MANSLHTYSVETWLGLQMPTNASPSVVRRANVAQLTIALLNRIAPDIVNLQPEASWTQAQQDELKAAVCDLPDDNDRRDVHNAIAHVIECGRIAGIWSHQPWSLRAIVQLAPSKVTRNDIDFIRRAAYRRERLLRALPQILDSGDELLLIGALIVSAADLSGLLQQNLVEQLLDRRLTFHAKSGLVWADLRLGSAKNPWRNVRRWLLDPMSQLLASKLLAQRQTDAKGQLNPKRVMGALAKVLDIPSNELTTVALIKSARTWWATQLPSCLHDYAIQPVVSMSLPATAWQRLLTGRPLCKDMAPLPVRKLAHGPGDALDDPLVDDVPQPLGEIVQKQTDFVSQHAALKALEKALRQPDQVRKLNALRVRQLMDAWNAKYAHYDGWVCLFGDWVRSTLFDRAVGPFGRGHGPRVAGILRYLEGFEKRFLQRFWDYTIGMVDESGGDWFRRMEQLRRDLATLASASVAKTGLCNFLRFAERHGAPKTEFGEDWHIVVSPSEADANLLTPIEYIRLKEWISVQYEGVENSYPALRAETMLVLAFRLGPRWDELRNLRLQDCVLSNDAEIHGSIWIRTNDFAHGKTSEFRRTLSIEHFLTMEERRLLVSFVTMAARLGHGSRPACDLLFADPGSLSLPPLERDTHDLIQLGMRIVSGDPSLVFHHLRHSAASFMYLRVMIDETQEANPFPWLCGWEHVSSLAILGAGRNYAATLSARSSHNASRLYLVSEMLGHLDPDTSMRSYVHFADVVMHQSTAAILEPAIELMATLDGIKPASVKRRLYRQSKQLGQQ